VLNLPNLLIFQIILDKDNLVLLLQDRNLFSTPTDDGRLCRVVSFSIQLPDGTSVAANISTNVTIPYVEELVEKHKIVVFVAKDDGGNEVEFPIKTGLFF